MNGHPQRERQRRLCNVHPLPPGCPDYSDLIEPEKYVRLRTDDVGSENQAILKELDVLLFRGTLEPVMEVCEQYGHKVAKFYRFPPPYYASEALYVPLIFLVPEKVTSPVAAPGS